MTAPWLDDGDVRLFHGDALDRLREMPSESVQCIVTSPPFWGLRDYGTGSWTGGSPECDHQAKKWSANGRASSTLAGTPQNHENEGQGGTCSRCGATRVDQQIGLEETPDEWCTRLVSVFREARRVLRNDGVCFIEIGDSYASAALRGGASSDTPCTPPPDSPDPDCACSDPDGERAASPELRSPRTDQPLPAPLEPHDTTSRDRSRSGSAVVDAAVALLGAQESTALAGASVLPPASSASAEALPLPPQTLPAPSAPGAPDRGHRDGCNCGTAGTSDPSAGRTQGTELSRKASQNHTSASLKHKDLVGAPWMLAFALRADGWYLRSEIIWHKVNPMPESVTDRPTKGHSTIFLLTKSARYFYDADAIREAASENTHARRSDGANTGKQQANGDRKDGGSATLGANGDPSAGRNARSVWSIPGSNAVRLRSDLSEADRASVLLELEARGLLGPRAANPKEQA